VSPHLVLLVQQLHLAVEVVEALVPQVLRIRLQAPRGEWEKEGAQGEQTVSRQEHQPGCVPLARGVTNTAFERGKGRSSAWNQQGEKLGPPIHVRWCM